MQVGREPNEMYEMELDKEMRLFFRRYYTHARYLSATPQVRVCVCVNECVGESEGTGRKGEEKKRGKEGRKE